MSVRRDRQRARWRRAARAFAVVLVALLGTAGPRSAWADTITDAVAAAERGDRAGAVEILESNLSRYRGNDRARALFVLGTLTVDFDQAKSRYEEVLDRHRGSEFAARALIQLGEAAFAGRELSAAHAYFREAADAARHDDDRALALFRDGQVLLGLDQPGEARSRFRQLVDEQPGSVLRSRTDALLGVCAYREGLYDDALDACRDLIDDAGPQLPVALLFAGRSLVAKSEVDLALEYFDRVASEFGSTASGAAGRAFADSLRVARGDRPDVRAPDPGLVTPVASALPDGDGSEASDGGEAQHVIQLGRYRERIRAFALLSDLRRRGIENASLEREQNEETRHFFIRVGPFATLDAATTERDRLEAISGVVGVLVEEAM